MICPDCNLEICPCKAKKQKQAQNQDDEFLKKVAKKVIKKKLTNMERLNLKRKKDNPPYHGR